MTVSQLDAILAPGALRILFQPIVELGGDGERRTFAVEALARGPSGTNLSSAATMFEYVRRKRAEPVMDRACVLAAMAAFAQAAEPALLSINVHASTLGRDAEFHAFVLDAAAAQGFPGGRLIVEIVEQVPYWHAPTFVANLRRLREAGVRIALDDVGAGQSNLTMLIETRPEFWKLDRGLVHGCPKDPYRRRILEAMNALATNVGARVVAEGVETEAELTAVWETGIQLVQGWHLGRPTALGCGAGRDAPDWIESGVPVDDIL